MFTFYTTVKLGTLRTPRLSVGYRTNQGSYLRYFETFGLGGDYCAIPQVSNIAKIPWIWAITNLDYGSPKYGSGHYQ